jgi:hypothetical protein
MMALPAFLYIVDNFECREDAVERFYVGIHHPGSSMIERASPVECCREFDVDRQSNGRPLEGNSTHPFHRCQDLLVGNTSSAAHPATNCSALSISKLEGCITSTDNRIGQTGSSKPSGKSTFFPSTRGRNHPQGNETITKRTKKAEGEKVVRQECAELLLMRLVEEEPAEPV